MFPPTLQGVAKYYDDILNDLDGTTYDLDDVICDFHCLKNVLDSCVYDLIGILYDLHAHVNYS